MMSILTTKRRRRPIDLPSVWLALGMALGCAVTLFIGWVIR